MTLLQSLVIAWALLYLLTYFGVSFVREAAATFKQQRSFKPLPGFSAVLHSAVAV
jgi:hypothetical protein